MVGFKPTDVPPTAAVKFIGAGTAACIADVFTFPLDTAKVRLQIQGELKSAAEVATVKYRGVFGTITTMVKTEGPRSLYSGLVAGLQRQMSFASVRIGLYDSVKQFYTKGSERAMAVAFAQPTDVVKVRFQAQANLSSPNRRYNSTIEAYKTIAKEEGVRGLWKESYCLKRGYIHVVFVQGKPASDWPPSLPLGCIKLGIVLSMTPSESRLSKSCCILTWTVSVSVVSGKVLNIVIMCKRPPFVESSARIEWCELNWLKTGICDPGDLLVEGMDHPLGTFPNIARNAIVNCTELVTYDLIKDLLMKNGLLSVESYGKTQQIGCKEYWNSDDPIEWWSSRGGLNGLLLFMFLMASPPFEDVDISGATS
eukprot:g47853.t1